MEIEGIKDKAIIKHFRDLERINVTIIEEMKELKSQNEKLKFANEALEELLQLMRDKYEPIDSDSSDD